jgi:hypothetical protein
LKGVIALFHEANNQIRRDVLKLGIRLPEETEREDTIPPMVYIHQATVWKYRYLHLDLRQEGPPDEEMLNGMAIEGWEMAGLFVYDHSLHIYFKRLERQ